MARAGRPSPLLGAVSTMIGEASGTLVTDGGRFRHSFELPLDVIAPDAGQPRKMFVEAEIEALAGTMAAQGQLQPILVRRDPEARRRWIIVAGERRWRAAHYNSWPSILAIEHIGDPEVAALLENLQRVDLSALEEARGLQRLIAGKGWSQDAAAAALGKSKSDVSATLRILSLPDEVLASVVTSELQPPKSVLVEMARIDDPVALGQLARLAQEGRLTVKAVREAKLSADAASPVHKGALPELRRVIGALEKACATAPSLSEGDREALHHLRAVVNALLKL